MLNKVKPAAGNGGGLYLVQHSLEIQNSRITGNEAYQNGGGVASSASDHLILSETDIMDNEAGSNGGGIWQNNHHHENNIDIFNSRILSNRAIRGGGGGIFAGRQVTLTDTEVSNNTAYDYGGGLYSGNRTSCYGTTGSSVRHGVYSNHLRIVHGRSTDVYLQAGEYISDTCDYVNQADTGRGMIYIRATGTDYGYHDDASFVCNDTGCTPDPSAP